jgi:hypothetical protein
MGSHRFLCVAIATVGLLMSGLAVPHTASADTRPHVTIFAVTDFSQSGSGLNNPGLSRAIDKASRDVVDFFREAYGVEAEVIANPTAARIRRWLFQELPLQRDNPVHLVFVLTHGHRLAEGREVPTYLLAGSDVDTNDWAGTGVRGIEFIEAMTNLPKRHSLFLFVDTCHAGGFKSAVADAIFNIADDARALYVMAASTASASTYDARFTRALLNVWRRRASRPCTDLLAFRTAVQDEMRSLGTSLEPEFPWVVFSFDKAFCGSAFGAELGLAFLYNDGKDHAFVDILDASMPGGKSVISTAREIARGRINGELLAHNSYRLSAWENNNSSVRSRGFALTASDPVQFVDLFGTAGPLARARAKDKIIPIARERGFRDEEFGGVVVGLRTDYNRALRYARLRSGDAAAHLSGLKANLRSLEDAQQLAANELKSADSAVSQRFDERMSALPSNSYVVAPPVQFDRSLQILSTTADAAQRRRDSLAVSVRNAQRQLAIAEREAKRRRANARAIAIERQKALERYSLSVPP